jgi:hypothetical protein
MVTPTWVITRVPDPAAGLGIDDRVPVGGTDGSEVEDETDPAAPHAAIKASPHTANPMAVDRRGSFANDAAGLRS